MNQHATEENPINDISAYEQMLQNDAHLAAVAMLKAREPFRYVVEYLRNEYAKAYFLANNSDYHENQDILNFFAD